MEMTSTPLGELARAHPSATRVFLRHRLDFCCGGRQSLADACAKAGLDAREIARELVTEAAGAEEETSWELRSAGELADHIVRRYHEPLRRDLPPLVEAARKVERVHAGKPAVPVGLADQLARFWTALESHMAKEEQVLFPALRGGAHGDRLTMPVRVLKKDHDDHAAQLARVRQLTGNLAIPAHACATWRALYTGLQTLEDELMVHIHLENNILFPRATG